MIIMLIFTNKLIYTAMSFKIKNLPLLTGKVYFIKNNTFPLLQLNSYNVNRNNIAHIFFHTIEQYYI
jgi:hypothetical protein